MLTLLLQAKKLMIVTKKITIISDIRNDALLLNFVCTITKLIVRTIIFALFFSNLLNHGKCIIFKIFLHM